MLNPTGQSRTWLCSNCNEARMAAWEKSCWYCHKVRDSSSREMDSASGKGDHLLFLGINEPEEDCWQCLHCERAFMAVWEKSCWNCYSRRDSSIPKKRPFPQEENSSLDVSKKDMTGLSLAVVKKDVTDPSFAVGQKDMTGPFFAVAQKDMTDYWPFNLIKREHEDQIHDQSLEIEASAPDQERLHETEDSAISHKRLRQEDYDTKRKIHYVVIELIRLGIHSLATNGLFRDDDHPIETASLMLSSLVLAFANKSESSSHSQDVTFVQKHRATLIEHFWDIGSELSKTDIDHIASEYHNDKFNLTNLYDGEEWFLDDILDRITWRGLTRRFTQKITTISPQSRILDVIAEEVQQTISPSKGTERQRFYHDVIFEVEWDPIAFIKEQCYDESPQEAIAKAITLTGTATEARAVESSQYTKDIWPFSSAIVMKLVQGVVSGRPDSLSYKLDDDTSLRGSMKGSMFVLYVSGTEPSSVVEVAQQLAWLGAALRTSPYERGIASCTPSISGTSCVISSDTDERGHSSGKQVQNPTVESRFKLSFSFNPLPCEAKYSNGQCWQNLFLNPVLVRGYPVTRRPKGVKGLELSLDVMATLLQASQLTWFGDRPFIKGFSALVVPTQVEQGAMLWHLVFNQSKKKRISYNDPRVPRSRHSNAEKIDDRTLERSRHILGWCSQVKSLTGAPTASYKITNCGLRKPQPDFILEKMTIAGGKFITAGMTAAIGKRDKGIIINARENYLTQLMWAANQYVLLFDVNDRRGWLVDGASTLLHLVRSSIKYIQNHKEFGVYCLFTWDQFQEAARQGSGNEAAVFVLMNEKNMRRRLFENPVEELEENSVDASGKLTVVTKTNRTYFHFSDKVEQIYRVLEQIVDHQATTAGEGGLNLSKIFTRRQLDGYDFMDIIEDRDPLYPKVYDPHGFSEGWVDLVKAIPATPIFGNGFGELIQPIDTRGLCSSWVAVPKFRGYLAVSVSIVTSLLQRGNMNEVPWRILDDIYWYPTGKSFEACQCEHVSSCDRVQVLLPSGTTRRRVKSISSPICLEEKGALIFGERNKNSIRKRDHSASALAIMQQTSRNSNDEKEEEVEQDATAPSSTQDDGIRRRAHSPCALSTMQRTSRNSKEEEAEQDAAAASSTQDDGIVRTSSVHAAISIDSRSRSRVRLKSFRQMLRGRFSSGGD